MHFLPYMMKPSRSFPAACHQHHYAARLSPEAFFFYSRDKVGTFCYLLAIYLRRKAYLKHRRYLKVLIHPPTHQTPRGRRRERKGRDNKRGKELLFLRFEKFRLSLWIKRLSGTVQVYGLVFLFLFSSFFFFFSYTHLYIQTCTSRLPCIHISLERERLLLTF